MKVRFASCSKGLRTLAGFAKTASLALRKRRGTLMLSASGIRNLTAGFGFDVPRGPLAVGMVYVNVQQWADGVYGVV